MFASQNENYFWCWTNAHADGQSDYWEKCGTSKGDQSYTVKGVPCQSICEMKESPLSNNYWWCRDDDQDPDSWDYCSPPGQVLISNRSFSRASKSRYARLNIQYMGTLALDSVLSRGRTTGGARSPQGLFFCPVPFMGPLSPS